MEITRRASLKSLEAICDINLYNARVFIFTESLIYGSLTNLPPSERCLFML